MTNKRSSCYCAIASVTILLIILLLPAKSTAKEIPNRYGSITGYVKDAKSGKPLEMANVCLENTLLGDATDSDGYFEIERIKPGKYLLRVSMMGYATQVKEIEVNPGKYVTVEFDLPRSPIEIAPVVTTAARREQNIVDSPVSLTAVSSRELEKRYAQTPDEILRYVPGVVVRESQASIRGSAGFNRGAGSRLLFLVDGIQALAGDTGDIKWDLIPVDVIQRIEVLKSAASSLYGSSGLGGVLNIVTRQPSSRPTTAIRLTGGYYDDPYYPQWKWTTEWLTSGSIDITHSRNLGPFGIIAAIGKRYNDGYRRNSDYHRENAYCKLTWKASHRHLLTALASWSCDIHGHSTQWRSQAAALDIDPAQWNDRVRSSKAISYAKLRTMINQRNIVTATFASYWNGWRNRFHDADDHADATRLGGSVQFDRIISSRLDCTLGVEIWHSNVNSTIFGNHLVGEWAGFAELRTRPSKRLAMTLGCRLDTHTKGNYKSQSIASPRVAAVFDIRENQSLNLAVGRGFRSPTIAEMFTSTTVGGFTVKPNPELSPETGTTWELGWRGVAFGNLIFDASVFRNSYQGLIEPELDPFDGKLHFVNLSDARISGAEIWIKRNFLNQRISSSFSYMYLSAEDMQTGEPLAYRSRHNLVATVETKLGDAWIAVDYTMRSRTEKVKVYEDDERVPIHVVDLRAEITVGRVKFGLKVSNLLQYNYTEIERNLAPIRHFTFSLRANP